MAGKDLYPVFIESILKLARLLENPEPELITWSDMIRTQWSDINQNAALLGLPVGDPAVLPSSGHLGIKRVDELIWVTLSAKCSSVSLNRENAISVGEMLLRLAKEGQ